MGFIQFYILNTNFSTRTNHIPSWMPNTVKLSDVIKQFVVWLCKRMDLICFIYPFAFNRRARQRWIDWCGEFCVLPFFPQAPHWSQCIAQKTRFFSASSIGNYNLFFTQTRTENQKMIKSKWFFKAIRLCGHSQRAQENVSEIICTCVPCITHFQSAICMHWTIIMQFYDYSYEKKRFTLTQSPQSRVRS